jgi:hypothetical protein
MHRRLQHGQKSQDSIVRQQTPGESWIMGMLRAAANITDSESRRLRLIGYDIIPVTDYLCGQGAQIGNDCHILIRGFARKAHLINGKYCAWPELRASYLAMVCFGQSRKKSAGIFAARPRPMQPGQIYMPYRPASHVTAS